MNQNYETEISNLNFNLQKKKTELKTLKEEENLKTKYDLDQEKINCKFEKDTITNQVETLQNEIKDLKDELVQKTAQAKLCNKIEGGKLCQDCGSLYFLFVIFIIFIFRLNH